MTKYMKIKPVDAFGSTNVSTFIDLYKINNIQESFVEFGWDEFTSNKYNFAQAEFREECRNIATVYGPAEPFLITTIFTAPGSRYGYSVQGTAQELMAHIEKQQLRARKSLEIEPYEPEVKLRTRSGEVHGLNEDYAGEHSRAHGRWFFEKAA